MINWIMFVLAPLTLFGFLVHFCVRLINKPIAPKRRMNAPTNRLVPVWAEIVLIEVPLLRYSIYVLGYVYFFQIGDSWEDNSFPALQAFRRLYPESFVDTYDSAHGFLFQMALILSDTLIVIAVLLSLAGHYQKAMHSRRQKIQADARQAPDETVWPPPPSLPLS